MEYGSRQNKVEEEIIEHYVSESIRTVPFRLFGDGKGSNKDEKLESIETTHGRATASSTKPIPTAFETTVDRSRLMREASSRDNSFSRASEHDRSISNIDSYGYDVHEIHTSEGGARVVQTHGSGLLHASGAAIQQRDRSFTEHIRNGDKDFEQRTVLFEQAKQPDKTHVATTTFGTNGYQHKETTSSSRLAATEKMKEVRPDIYTVPVSRLEKQDIWRESTDENSLQRKDSYKRMQIVQQEEMADHYVPQSDASLMTGSERRTLRKVTEQPSRCDQFRLIIHKFLDRMRETECTPRLMLLTLILLLLLFFFFILLGIILNAIFGTYSVRTLILHPPVCDDCKKFGVLGSTDQSSSTLHVHYYSDAQAHLELVGGPPFKSNSFTAIDFNSGYVAIADHALTDRQGKHITCFIMPLDRSAIPNIEALKDALSHIYSEVQSEFGWQEYWQYQAEPIDSNAAQRKFSSRIDECLNARWYFLKHTVYTKDSSCSDCFDFCLPDYSIQRLHKYQDEMTLGIRRLNCFRLYVPEWAKFQVSADGNGGRWSYPKSDSNIS